MSSVSTRPGLCRLLAARLWHLWLALPLLMALSAPSTAAEPVNQVKSQTVANADEVALKQLVSLLQQTATLQAEVRQLVIDQNGRNVQELTAKLHMQKPDNFRWEIVMPYNELLVTDGKKTWHYEPDLEQATIAAFDRNVDRTPMMLLNGNEQSIGESYSVSTLTMSDGVHQRFTLLPRKTRNLFERMNLTFKGAVLEEMQFEDSLGQQTSLTFKGLVRNAALDTALFGFKVPQGTTVIDNIRN